MSGIMWLASYPKSGNTWLRIFLANLFSNPDRPVDINSISEFQFGDMEPRHFEKISGRPITEMSDQELHKLRPAVHKMFATARFGESALVKTHNAVVEIDGLPIISPEATVGAIYVLRNPFDLVISLADHYGSSIDDSIEAIASEAHRVRTGPKTVFQHLGSWHNHADSWVHANGMKLLLVKYEQMTKNPVKAFGSVVKFLGLPKDTKRLKKAIKFSSFDTLSRQEKQGGFIEKSANSDSFFRSGKVGGWKSVLSDQQIERIKQTQSTALIEFGYMKPDGTLKI